MDSIITSIIAILVGGVFGLIFVSPVFLLKWYLNKKNKSKYLRVQNKLEQLYPKLRIISVRYCLPNKLNNLFKLSNFNGTGYLILRKKEIIYQDFDLNKLPIIFPIKNVEVAWVGYHLGSSWVPWFTMNLKGEEKYYFTGETINWTKNMEIFREIARVSDKEIEIRTSEILNANISDKNASWFNIIGFLTLANTAFVFFKTNISFMYGLTIVQISDGAFILSGLNNILGLLISLVVCYSFVQLGKSAKKGNVNAYKIGLIILSIDSLILLGIIVSSNASVAYLMINIFFRTLAISAMIRGAFVQKK